MEKSRMRFAALLSSLPIIAAVACVLSPGVAAQINIKGSWSWESRPDKTGSRTVVGFGFITQRGSRVSGSYSVSATGGPEDDDGAGAGSIPFIGTNPSITQITQRG